MANSTVQARVNPELKEEAEAIFGAMGMTTAEAIRIFLQQTVNNRGLPFRPTIGGKQTTQPNDFLLSIVGIAPAAENDLSERDEEILANEIDPVRGWGLNRNGS